MGGKGHLSLGKAHTHVLPQQGCLSFPSPGVGAGWARFRRCPPYLPLSSLYFPRSLPHTPSHSSILISPSFLLFCYFLLFFSSFIYFSSPSRQQIPIHPSLTSESGGGSYVTGELLCWGGGGRAPGHSCLPLRYDSADPQAAKSWIFVIPGGKGRGHTSCFMASLLYVGITPPRRS